MADQTTTPFLPLKTIDGYLPLEDFGLIGDGTTAALVGRDGGIAWLCLPRFDSPPLFCGLLDAARGGQFLVTLQGLVESRQYYEPDTGVLVTEMRSQSGLVRVTDALALPAGATFSELTPPYQGHLLRSIKVLRGSVSLLIDLNPKEEVLVSPETGGLRLHLKTRPELTLHFSATPSLKSLRSTHTLQSGTCLHMALRWNGSFAKDFSPGSESLLRETQETWRRWLRRCEYEGPQAALVRRSVITLKLLNYWPSGAIIAAPTSSLPAVIGGSENWDSRYVWIRDVAFSASVLRRVGFTNEAFRLLEWVMATVQSQEHPPILYDVDGQPPPPEQHDFTLEGYRRSSPVRWGHAAPARPPHTIYGEILDCAYQWAAQGADVSLELWNSLRRWIEMAHQHCGQPDSGMWQDRTPTRPSTYSVALCQIALGRGAQLAKWFGFPGDVKGWQLAAEDITHAILERAWSEPMGSLTNQVDGDGVDVSLLTLPLRRVLPISHPKMMRTTATLIERLAAGNGLVYRYPPGNFSGDPSGHEGAFIPGSFWVVENLAQQGRLDEAMTGFNSLCAHANWLGLLPESLDPVSGAFLGNFPHAPSHVGLISSGLTLAWHLSNRQ